MKALTLINLQQISETVSSKYSNLPQPNSDESFFYPKGQLNIELQDQLIELNPGQLYTIPTNVLHRIRPKGERTVNSVLNWKPCKP